MAFDGLTVHAVAKELGNELVGARITKIYQPSRFDLVFHCRRPGGGRQLLVSGHPQYARAHLTENSYTNPLSPPAFCMLLRKHLEGGKITSVRQVDFERIIEITVENLSDNGETVDRTLIIEIMGRHSNVILIDAAESTVLDAMNRVTEQISRYRQVLPGERYIRPPKQDKLNPLETTEAQFISQLGPSSPQARLSKVIMQVYLGISPTTSREIVARAGLSPDSTRLDAEGKLEALWKSFASLLDDLKNGKVTPCVAFDEHNQPIEFAPYPLQTEGVVLRCYDSISEAIDTFYHYRVTLHQLRQMAGDLNRIVSTHLNRLESKMEKQMETLKKAENAEQYRILGELLTANLYRVSPGQSTVTVENFYSEDQEPVTIELDPSISPADNAQKYFRLYSKAKNSLTVTRLQLEAAKAEIDYLQDVQAAIELAESISELEEIREELIAEGYIKEKSQPKRKKPKKQTPAPPLRFNSSDGIPIFVGRNNRQNDHLTFSVASSGDIWLHVKDIPGSHVIIKSGGKPVPDTTLEEAAKLAAYYSKGRESANVPVDYTARKNVRKPSGAKPGKVIYENYKTVFVTPDPGLATRLSQSNNGSK